MRLQCLVLLAILCTYRVSESYTFRSSFGQGIKKSRQSQLQFKPKVDLESPCLLERVFNRYFAGANMTQEFKNLRFNQTVRYREKVLPSYMTPDLQDLILGKVTCQWPASNKSIIFTNITLLTSLDLFDKEYDDMNKDRTLPIFNAMVPRMYEKITGRPASTLERVRILNLAYDFKALMYSNRSTQCIALRMRTLIDDIVPLYRQWLSGDLKERLEKRYNESIKVKKIGKKKLLKMEEEKKKEAAEAKKQKKRKTTTTTPAAPATPAAGSERTKKKS